MLLVLQFGKEKKFYSFSSAFNQLRTRDFALEKIGPLLIRFSRGLPNFYYNEFIFRTKAVSFSFIGSIIVKTKTPINFARFFHSKQANFCLTVNSVWQSKNGDLRK